MSNEDEAELTELGVSFVSKGCNGAADVVRTIEYKEPKSDVQCPATVAMRVERWFVERLDLESGHLKVRTPCRPVPEIGDQASIGH